jgi:hypothetical protein
MRSLSLFVFSTVVVVVACGGTERLPSHGADAAAGDDADASSTPCSAGGVRICGMGCPTLDTTSCPGGCQPVSTLSGGDAGISVCWSDDPSADVLCSVCSDGQACLQRTPSSLVCVPLDLCAHLWDIGVRDVCRYADKSTYDDEPLATPSGCPADATILVCGGTCTGCPDPGSANRCVGRSPNHPFGICPPDDGAADPNDPSSIAVCSFTNDGYTVPCVQPGSPDGPVSCAVFQTPASDESVARLYGLCIDQGLCTQMATDFPGGLQCYDAGGNLL